jgi:response regulator RpfG family c-di-GMP phosphodiesterase
VLADTVMPGRTGYEICQYLKMSPRHKHVRVILTAGVLENFDDELLKRVEADSTLKKPFEATALLATVKPLAEAATAARVADPSRDRKGVVVSNVAAVAPFVAVVDSEQVKAAVTIALDAAMETMVDEITRRVVTALQTKPPVAEAEPPKSAAPEPPSAPIMETVRRVSTLRVRSTSILGLDHESPRPPAPE